MSDERQNHNAPKKQKLKRQNSSGESSNRQHQGEHSSSGSPERHHSTNAALRTLTSPSREPAEGLARDDVILWQSMSPSGTLKRVIRQRNAQSPKDTAKGAATGLTHGIVQQILDMRNTSNSGMEAVDGRGGNDKMRRTASCELASEPETPLSLESNLGSPLDLTPLAERKTRSIPRPLAMSKSEKLFDRRELLSSLLLASPEQAKAGEGNSVPSQGSTQSADSVPQNARVREIPHKPASLHPAKDGKNNANGAAVSICRPPSQTEDCNAIRAAKDASSAEIDIDDIDLDGLLDGIDQDGAMEDLLQQYDGELCCDTKADPAASKSAGYPLKDCEKCLTLLVTEGLYTSTQIQAPGGTAGARPQKTIKVYSETARKERTVILRDEWYSTKIAIGDYLNIVGTIPKSADTSGIIIGTHSTDLLPILHPDVLVSCKYLSESFTCKRRAVLKDRIKEITDDSTPSSLMLIGNLLHNLFESCALRNMWDDETIAETIKSLITDSLEDLWKYQVDESSVYQRMTECVPIYQEWAKDYMHGSSALGSQHLTHRGSTPADMKATVAISKIINTEENVWSPKFGLKGKVDLTVLSRYSGMGAFVEPLELKTGRNTTNTAHRAQLILYTLLLSERYGIDIRSGLLYFPRSGELIRVPRYDDELRGLIAARNELTTYLVHTTQTSRPLPDPIGHEYECKRCSFRPSCFIAHRALERGSEESAQMPKDVWESQVGHLADSHLEFLRTWMRLLDSEEGDMLRFRSELWNMNSEYRELQTGHCLSNMKLEVHSIEDTGVIGSYSRYKQTFVPATRDAHRSLLDSQISVGDPITVSSESGQYAFTLGYVFSLEYSSITLVLERPVRGTPKHVAGFDPKCNQDFESILEIRQRGTSRQQEETILHPVVPQSASEDTYRIDKDELSTGMSKIRANIMRLFIADIGDSKRCRLIVDLQQPSFSPLGEELEQKVQAVQYERRLNAGQASVLRKVLSANDYALVMGMPGTGKTTTIAELVEVLVAQGKSVLLASYTHVAVDNILLKLQERDIPMIRLGNRNKVHPRIVQHLPSETKFESVQQLDSYFRKAPVVATTCLGINHPVFTVRTFDYCIVDEASQITLPVCLGPLFVANTFVLVGDHHQLPPLVRNTAARDAGLGASLFKRLCEAHPSAVVRLEYQYRMNSDIQRLANNMIYDGHLRCGSLKVANQKIKYKSSPEAVIDKWPFAQEKPNPQFRMPWAVDALDPTRGAVFIDTDLLPGRESRVEGYDVVLNDTEIKVIKVLTTVLQGCGVDGRQVGILSAYRIQLKQLEIEYGIRFDADGKLQAPPSSRQLPSIADATTSRSSSGNASTEATPNADALCYTGIEMHTIDRYQGRDADVVVISWVRSNVGQAIGDLLRDWHRINVAITRARYKLIMVGSKSTLSRSPLLAGMLQAISRDGGLIRIPANTVLPVTTAYSRSIARKNSGTGTGSNRAGSALLRNMPVASNIVSE